MRPATGRFFIEGLAFKTSHEVPGVAAFLRCPAGHHNGLVRAADSAVHGGTHSCPFAAIATARSPQW